MIFQADFLDNGEGVNAERCVYGKISTRSFRSHHFRCTCTPCFGENQLGKSSEGVCYLACYTVLLCIDCTMNGSCTAFCIVVHELLANNVTSRIRTRLLSARPAPPAVLFIRRVCFLHLIYNSLYELLLYEYVCQCEFIAGKLPADLVD